MPVIRLLPMVRLMLVCSAAMLVSACSHAGSALVPSGTTSSGVVRTAKSIDGQAVFVTPTALGFASASSRAQAFVATQNFDGDITAVSADPSCATVNPPVATPAVDPTNGGQKSATFTVSPGGSTSCSTTITVTDKKGNTATVQVSIGPVLLVASKNTIEAFPLGANGDAAPSYVISGSNTFLGTDCGPGGNCARYLSRDAGGDLFVTAENGSILEFAPGAAGNASPVAIIADAFAGRSCPGAVGFDASGSMWVPYCNSYGVVDEFPAASNGIVSPAASIHGPYPLCRDNTGAEQGLGNLLQAKGDAVGNVYVLSEKVETCFGAPTRGRIIVFAPGANGQATPASVLFGDFSYPRGFFIGSRGQLYVTGYDSSNPSLPGFVEVYAPGASGYDAPIAKITGSSTGLGSFDSSQLRDVAVDEAGGRIYVSDSLANSIYVFPIGAVGNVAPIAVIRGPGTALSEPWGLSFGVQATASTAPPPPPGSSGQCKDALWLSFGVFKNQGDCVSYFSTNFRNPPG